MFLFPRCESLDNGFSEQDYKFLLEEETCVQIVLKGIMLLSCPREIVVRCAYSLCECAFYMKCWINHVKIDGAACHDGIMYNK